MRFFLVLAALGVIHGALGQTPSTNLTFFQRFVAGEIPVREIVWKARSLPTPTNRPVGGGTEGWAGWVTDSAFSALVPAPESKDEEAMFRGASRRQYWCARPRGIQTVDRDKSAPSFLGVQSEPFSMGHWGVHEATAFRSLGLPPMEPGSVRWHPDGRFSAMTTEFGSYRSERLPVSGRIVRQGDAGPLEIEFRAGTKAQLQRVEFSYGTKLGVALPERIVKFEGPDPAVPTSEFIIKRVNLDVSDLSREGFTPWMFTRPNWSTNLTTWTNSTVHDGPGGPGTKLFVPWVERFYSWWRRILSWFN